MFALGSATSAQSNIEFNKIYTVLPGVHSCLTSSIMLANNGYIVYCETRDSVNNERVAILKVDTQGNLLWAKHYGRMGFQYYTTYSYGGGGVSVPWGGYAGTGSVTNDSNTWSKMLLFRFDNNGDTLWSKIYNDSAYLQCTSLKVTRDKGFVIGGQWESSSSFLTVTLGKTDSLGNLLWQKTYNGGGYSRLLTSIDTCKDGGFIISATDYYYGCSSHALLIKTDSLGNVDWEETLPDITCGAQGFGVTTITNGEYIESGVNFTSSTYPNSGELRLAKISGNGSVIWQKTYTDFINPSPSGAAFIMARELSNGDIIACGSAIDSNNTIWGVIMKTDSTGNKLWLQNYFANEPQDYLNDIRPTADGGFVASGFTYSTESIWVVKTDSLGVTTGEKELSEGIPEGKVKVFPNPNNGVFQLQIKNYELKENIVEVYNMLGEKIYSTRLNATNIQIDLNNSASGIYLYRVVSEMGDLVSEGKFVIEK